MLTELEKKVVAALQGDLPVTARPFRRLAADIDMAEAHFLDIVTGLCRRGVIRRFGATIRHQRSGFSANAMVAWQVPETRVDTVGELFAGYDAVSHCYRRRAARDWPYNLYTMIHAGDAAACHSIAAQMARAAAVDTYRLLFSEKEWKKTSMTYFSE